MNYKEITEAICICLFPFIMLIVTLLLTGVGIVYFIKFTIDIFKK